MKTRDDPIDLFRWLLRPNPRRFLTVWYTVWLVLSLKAFVVNWLIRHQPIRIAWMPVTGPVETCYLLAEIGVVGAIVWQAWRFERANWRLAFIYEWYSLAELSLSLVNPHLWNYAMSQMLGLPFTWNDAATTLMSHVGFVAFYGFVHHGLPLLVLRKVIKPQPASLVNSY